LSTGDPCRGPHPDFAWPSCWPNAPHPCPRRFPHARDASPACPCSSLQRPIRPSPGCRHSFLCRPTLPRSNGTPALPRRSSLPAPFASPPPAPPLRLPDPFASPPRPCRSASPSLRLCLPGPVASHPRPYRSSSLPCLSVPQPYGTLHRPSPNLFRTVPLPGGLAFLRTATSDVL
jgi:hypothetical protein